MLRIPVLDRCRVATVHSAEATLERADADLARAKLAYDKGAGSKQDLDTAVAARNWSPMSFRLLCRKASSWLLRSWLIDSIIDQWRFGQVPLRCFWIWAR